MLKSKWKAVARIICYGTKVKYFPVRLSQSFVKTSILDEESVTDAELFVSEGYLQKWRGCTRTKSGADWWRKSWSVRCIINVPMLRITYWRKHQRTNLVNRAQRNRVKAEIYYPVLPEYFCHVHFLNHFHHIAFWTFINALYHLVEK